MLLLGDFNADLGSLAYPPNEQGRIKQRYLTDQMGLYLLSTVYADIFDG